MSYLDEFTAGLAFPLDDFQLEGCQAVEEGHGVLVCAPTGAGKTIVGEFAVALALSQGTKCFYTTPIKALSNQKYHDLVAVHGAESVGLLTGDVSINAQAEVVVMTTEVLRNMIYAQSSALDRLTHVVMDEIHYLADRERGAVWEEIILNLDESVNIIGLSATVSNSEEFGDWLATVRGDTRVIVSDHRPVPLDQWMLVGRRIYPLFEPGTDDVNIALENRIERIQSTDTSGEDYREGRGFRARSAQSRGQADGHSGRFGRDARSGPPRQEDKFQPVGRPDVVKVLEGQNMLPAIFFIFSRAGCDGALAQCHRSRLVMTDQEESEEIKRIIDAGVEGIPEEDLEVLRFRQWRSVLSRGFAAHHAGMLPAFRHIVEELFVKGLVRVVFATETLALGINMPARTVVLEKLVKYDGESHVDLTPGQYTQLTGRAGRRGIDTMGNAVVQWSPAMDPRAVAGLASTRTYPLISTFAPGYNMAINLLAMNGFEGSVRLLEKSFAQYQSDGSIVDDVRTIERTERKLSDLRAQLPYDDADVDAVMEYVDLRAELSAEEKAQRRYSMEQRELETTTVLAKLQVGDVIAMPGKKHPILATVVTPASQARDPRPWVTTERGWSGRIDAAGFANPPVVVGRMRLPKNVTHHPRKNTRFVVEAFRRDSFDRPKKMRTQARVRDSKKVVALREALHNHPVHNWKAVEREQAAHLGAKIHRAENDLARLRGKVSEASDTLGRHFERIIDLLTELDYVGVESGEPHVTDEGERLALIHNASDLLVAQCLKRGIWDDLDPAELAGVVSMCAFEPRKTTHGEPSAPTDPMVDAMNGTERVWEQLASDERRHQLPTSPMPEAQFALAMHQWTAGAPLGYCLAAAAESGAELTPGDFVRSVLQVIDLLEQVAKTAYSDDTRRTARRAIDAARRGVVAIGT
ncbi:DEAD/DEAH box helicase [Corynebacterium guangdongense]|uniref:ATP-dependent RNA helicase HelY n=1 Tax=Corynebacterium guangdongense TaxID=1783348 RepID=A0ABU1ZWM1_9CORY|nr:RNA helicase [Corynebacterium guangdongense]MDR7329333.1 ATP-dependent RNA helicase HelY [Corynebacterium guangdongense]WJZ17898.1 ski2-like helicase [Corynebacterium guangdongense]